MDETRIHIGLDTSRQELQEADRIDLEAVFEIPLESRTRSLSVAGLVLNLVGVLLFVGMAILVVATGPTVWFALDGDVAASQSFKAWAGTLTILGTTFLLTGLALYTFGRTVRGSEELEAVA